MCALPFHVCHVPSAYGGTWQTGYYLVHFRFRFQNSAGGPSLIPGAGRAGR